MAQETDSAAPSRWNAARVVFVILVGPILVLAARTGSKIAAEREAFKLSRELAAITSDGRPGPRGLLHVSRGSGAFLRELDRRVREGPYPERAGIARALGASKRLEMLRPLILHLRDGNVDPEEAAYPASTAPRGWPLRLFPPDLLALEAGGEGDYAMIRLARDEDEDPFVQAWAETYSLAVRMLPEPGRPRLALEHVRAGRSWAGRYNDINVTILRSLTSDAPLIRARAVTLWARAELWHSVDQDVFSLGAKLLGPTPIGRIVAKLFSERPSKLEEADRERILGLAAELTEADLELAKDPSVTARAARALARGDPEAARTLGLLGTRDPAARDALVAAVSSGSPADVSQAAAAALEGLNKPR